MQTVAMSVLMGQQRFHAKAGVVQGFFAGRGCSREGVGDLGLSGSSDFGREDGWTGARSPVKERRVC